MMSIEGKRIYFRDGTFFYTLEIGLDKEHVVAAMGRRSSVTVYHPTVEELRECRLGLTKAIDQMVHRCIKEAL